MQIEHEAAIQEIRDIIHRFDRSPRKRGYLGVHQGKLVLQEVSPEQEAAWIRRLEELVTALESDCEVVGGSAILDFAPDRRKDMPRILGAGVADALAIAYKRDAVLWTDDLTTAALAWGEWKVSRVWTEMVLLISPHILERTALAAAVAKLFAWGYGFTRLSVDAVLYLLQESNWHSDREPVASAIEYVCRWGGANLHNCAVTALIIDGIWHRCPRQQIAKNLIRRILEGIGRGISGPLIARPLYRRRLLGQAANRQRTRRLSRFLRRWRSRSPSSKRKPP